jgi:hypothetical protein
MEAEREFKEGTLLKVSQGVHGLLTSDAEYFGFEKGGKANLSGFPQRTHSPNLPSCGGEFGSAALSEFKNEKNAKVAEKAVFKLYLGTFDADDDAKKTISLRVNGKNRKYFTDIHDADLSLAGMDFAPYLKSLLNEYSVRPLWQREQCYQWSKIKKLREAIRERKRLRIRSADASLDLFPCSLDVSPVFGCCLVTGIDCAKRAPTFFPLSEVEGFTVIDERHALSAAELNLIAEFMEREWA